MAVLPDNDRIKLWAEVMSLLSDAHETCTINKIDLRAALNAADDWADSNAASYNSALPLPARTSLTARQKAKLLMIVLRRRYEVS